MKKFLVSVIVIIYVVIAISVTFCLLNYNENKVTVFGDKTLLIITDDELQPNYANGDLVIVSKENINDTKSGEKIFFYANDVVKIGAVQQVNKYEGVSSTFIVDGEYQVIEDEVIGKASTAKRYGKLGKILGLLESKWGFLFVIIFPSVLMCLNEIFQVITEIRGGSEEKSSNRRNDRDYGRDDRSTYRNYDRENDYDRESRSRPRDYNREDDYRRNERPRPREYDRDDDYRRNPRPTQREYDRNYEREDYRRDRREGEE